jgi:glycosyltransferase involved in cell wall biosynthesis
MVAAEAMAVATPVVAFDIPCLRDIVTATTGVLVRPFDIDELARAIASLAEDPPRRAHLGSAGAARVASMGWSALAERQSEVYRGVLGGRPLAAGVAITKRSPVSGDL